MGPRSPTYFLLPGREGWGDGGRRDAAVPAAGRAQPNGLGVCGEGGTERGVLSGVRTLSAPRHGSSCGVELWGGGTSVTGCSQWGLSVCGFLRPRDLWGGGCQSRGSPMGFAPLWGVITAPDVGWRCGGWGTLILKVLSGVCPFQRPHSGSRHGVVLWGRQENPQTHCWGGRGRGMLWGRGTHHGGPQWGFVPSWCPIMAPRVGWCCGAEDTDPGGLQWGRSSAGVPLRLRAVLWGGWMEVTPPHCWGRGGRCDAAPMGLQWGLCPRGGPIMAPGVGWWASIPEVSNGVLSPPGVGPAVVPSVGRGYGVDGVTLSPIAGEGERRGNAARKGGWH